MRRSLILILLPGFLLLACGRGETPKGPSFDGAPVIIVSIDTLRADRLPAYGYDGIETPALDAFRRDAILFRNAWSHAPLTLPAHAALLTGLLPHDAGVQNNIGYRLDGSKTKTLAALLRENGYATGAAVSAWVLRSDSGVSDGFDFYDDQVEIGNAAAAGGVQRPGSETIAAASDWIGRQGENAFFFMLHLFEPHTPYEAPEPFRSRYSDAYDAEVAYTDTLVGSFFEKLKESGIYDRALIIVLSDHGEGLGDHGEEEHGIFLYREAIQVPLLVKLPANERGGTEVRTNAALVDVFPTVAALTGAKPPAGLPGVSLLTLDADPALADRPIYSETFYPRIHLGWSELRSLVSGSEHFIDAPSPELYDLESDPAETVNILSDRRRSYARLREAITAFPRELKLQQAVSAEDAAKLQALGYLGGGSSASGPLPDPKEKLHELESLKRASVLSREGRPDEAVQLLAKLVEANPRFTDAVMSLAKAYEDSGRTDEAIETYKRAIALNPSNVAGPAMSAGWLYFGRGDLDEAAAHAEIALSDHPAYAKLLLGWVALVRGDASRADALAREVMNDGAYRVRAHILLAQTFVKRRDPATALATIEAARQELGAAPLPPLFEFTRGDILVRLNRVAEGEAAFRNEIRLYPAAPQAYGNLSALYVLAGRSDLAAQTMEALVRANPSPASYAFAEKTFRDLGRADLAEEWRRRAAKR